MKQITNCATIIGFATPITIWKKIPKFPAPSSFAELIISTGSDAKYCFTKNTTLIAPNIFGIIKGNGVIVQPIASYNKKEETIDIVFGNIIVDIRTANIKPFKRNSSFAKAYPAIVEAKIPTKMLGIYIQIVFHKLCIKSRGTLCPVKISM